MMDLMCHEDFGVEICIFSKIPKVAKNIFREWLSRNSGSSLSSEFVNLCLPTERVKKIDYHRDCIIIMFSPKSSGEIIENPFHRLHVFNVDRVDTELFCRHFMSCDGIISLKKEKHAVVQSDLLGLLKIVAPGEIYCECVYCGRGQLHKRKESDNLYNCKFCEYVFQLQGNTIFHAVQYDKQCFTCKRVQCLADKQIKEEGRDCHICLNELAINDLYASHCYMKICKHCIHCHLKTLCNITCTNCKKNLF